jgi:hypothetical protein
MGAPANALICVMCGKPATQRCTQCRSQIYCGNQCQKSDWHVHTLLCSSYQQFQTPPHKNARRAIVFEQNEPVVKFKWVSIEIKDAGEPGEPEPYESPNLEEYFGPGERGHCQPYYNNAIRGRRLRDYIDLRFRDDFLFDGSTPNRAVAAVAPSAGGNVWCGPLIALKWEGPGNSSMLRSNLPYTHMEMGDLREVVDYLASYARISKMERARATSVPRMLSLVAPVGLVLSLVAIVVARKTQFL